MHQFCVCVHWSPVYFPLPVSLINIPSKCSLKIWYPWALKAINLSQQLCGLPTEIEWAMFYCLFACFNLLDLRKTGAVLGAEP